MQAIYFHNHSILGKFSLHNRFLFRQQNKILLSMISPMLVLHVSNHLEFILTFFFFSSAGIPAVVTWRKSSCLWSAVNWWNMREQRVKRNGIFGIRTIQTQASDKCICLYVGACQKGPAEGTARSSGESDSAAPLRVLSLLRVGEQLWGHRCCVRLYPHLHAECPMHSAPLAPMCSALHTQRPMHTVRHTQRASPRLQPEQEGLRHRCSPPVRDWAGKH